MQTPTSILVVDTDAQSRAAVVSLLRDHGYAADEAHNGVDGILQARARPPALVILDPWPFVAAAAQLLVRIHELEPRVGVLVLTTVDRPASRLQPQGVRALRYLEKPCSAERLLAEVRQLLETSPGIDVAASGEAR